MLPLAAAVRSGNGDVEALLLLHGADPNLEDIMLMCARSSVAEALQLLIDAGGDPNRTWMNESILDVVSARGTEGLVAVLLGQPLLEIPVALKASRNGNVNSMIDHQVMSIQC